MSPAAAPSAPATPDVDTSPKALKRLIEELDTLGHCAARHGWLASGDHCREAMGVITTLRAALARAEGEGGEQADG